jgi:hypothetical protein
MELVSERPYLTLVGPIAACMLLRLAPIPFHAPGMMTLVFIQISYIP